MEDDEEAVRWQTLQKRRDRRRDAIAVFAKRERARTPKRLVRLGDVRQHFGDSKLPLLFEGLRTAQFDHDGYLRHLHREREGGFIISGDSVRDIADAFAFDPRLRDRGLDQVSNTILWPLPRRGDDISAGSDCGLWIRIEELNCWAANHGLQLPALWQLPSNCRNDNSSLIGEVLMALAAAPNDPPVETPAVEALPPPSAKPKPRKAGKWEGSTAELRALAIDYVVTMTDPNLEDALVSWKGFFKWHKASGRVSEKEAQEAYFCVAGSLRKPGPKSAAEKFALRQRAISLRDAL